MIEFISDLWIGDLGQLNNKDLEGFEYIFSASNINIDIAMFMHKINMVKNPIQFDQILFTLIDGIEKNKKIFVNEDSCIILLAYMTCVINVSLEEAKKALESKSFVNINDEHIFEFKKWLSAKINRDQPRSTEIN